MSRGQAPDSPASRDAKEALRQAGVSVEDTQQAEAHLAQRALMDEIDAGFGTGPAGAIPSVGQVQAWQARAIHLVPSHRLTPAYEAGLHLLLQYHRCQADRQLLQPSDPCVAFVSDADRWEKVLPAQGKSVERLQSLRRWEEQFLRRKTAQALSAARHFLETREHDAIRNLASLRRRLNVLGAAYGDYVNRDVLNELREQGKQLQQALASRDPADIDRLPLKLQRAWDLQPYVTCANALTRIHTLRNRPLGNAFAYERARDAYRAVQQLPQDKRTECETVDGDFRTGVQEVYRDYFRTAVDKAFALLSDRETWREGHDVLMQLVSRGDLSLPRGSPEHDYAVRKRKLFLGLMAGQTERRLARHYDDPRGPYQHFRGEKALIR